MCGGGTTASVLFSPSRVVRPAASIALPFPGPAQLEGVALDCPHSPLEVLRLHECAGARRANGRSQRDPDVPPRPADRSDHPCLRETLRRPPLRSAEAAQNHKARSRESRTAIGGKPARAVGAAPGFHGKYPFRGARAWPIHAPSARGEEIPVWLASPTFILRLSAPAQRRGHGEITAVSPTYLEDATSLMQPAHKITIGGGR